MKNNISKTVATFILFSFFFLGFQQSTQAQLTVQNNTNCIIYAQLNEGPRCNGTLSGTHWIAPGASAEFPITGNWVSVEYGVTPNPVEAAPPIPFTGIAYYSSNCGMDVFGNCLGANFSHSWVSNSSTQSTLEINQ